MSSVSSVGSDPSLYSLLQTLSGQTSSTSSSTTAPTTTPATDPDADGSSVKGSGKHHGGGHHHGGGGGGTVSSELESSITSALSSAPPGSDPNTVIQQAIQNQLEGKAADGSPLPPSDPSTTSTTAAAQGAGGAADSQAAFSQLLQAHGVDPKSFQQDLQTAVEGAKQNGGTVDFSTLFQSFPPGSAVDTVA